MTKRSFIFLLILAAVTSFISGGSVMAETVSYPTYEKEPWPVLTDDWSLGDPSGVAVDAQDNVWVLHRPRTLSDEQYQLAAPPVVLFNPEGERIKSWGGESPEYEWPQREHFIHVDQNGYVWIGGNYCPDRDLPRLRPVNDDQILKFTNDGEYIAQIGQSDASRGNSDTTNLHQPGDAAYYPADDELFVADGYGNHRVIVFDATNGEFKRMWGAFGNRPAGEDLCPPPALRQVPDGPGPDQFNVVHAIRVSNDGLVYVADRENRRVQVFDKYGTFIEQLIRHEVPFARNLTLSSDPEQTWLFIGGGSGISIVHRKSMTVLDEIEVPGMYAGGHHIAADSQHNIYIAGSFQGMTKLSVTGTATVSLEE